MKETIKEILLIIATTTATANLILTLWLIF